MVEGLIYSGGASARSGDIAITLRRQLVLLTFLMSAACAGNPVAPDSSDSMPAWLTALIRQSEEQPIANPPAFIARYEYKGQRLCRVLSGWRFEGNRRRAMC